MPSELLTLCSGLSCLELVEGSVLRKAKVPSILTEDGFIREALAEAAKLTAVLNVLVNSQTFRRALARSTNLNWKGATPAQREAAVGELVKLIQGLPSEFSPGVETALAAGSAGAAKKTHEALASRHAKIVLNTGFVQANLDAVRALDTSTSIFFGAEYERQADRFRKRAQNTIARGLEQGLGRSEIAQDLRREFRRAAVNEHYWETVAAVHVNRARSFASLVTYAEAGVEAFEITAIIDSRTTDVCRFLDGKVLSVEGALNQFDAIEDAEDLDQVKQASPFMRTRGSEIVLPNGTRVASIDSDGGFSNGLTPAQLESQNIGAPPYHLRCRTTLVPVFSGE